MPYSLELPCMTSDMLAHVLRMFLCTIAHTPEPQSALHTRSPANLREQSRPRRRISAPDLPEPR